MTRRELEHLLSQAKIAADARDRRLMLAFFVLFGLALALVPITLFLGLIPKALIIGCYGIIVASFVAVGIYTVATSHAFHLRTGAKCPRCAAPIGWIQETLLDEALGAYTKGEAVTCKSCDELLVHVRPRL